MVDVKPLVAVRARDGWYGYFLDLLPLFDNGGLSPEIDFGWSGVADALVRALVIVMIDEGIDLAFKCAR